MWDQLKPVNELLPVQEFILSHLNLHSKDKKRHSLLCSRQKVVNQAVIQYAVLKKIPTLIICSDEGRYAEWQNVFQDVYNLEDTSEVISELGLKSNLTPFSLATYGKFCNTVNAKPEERYQARAYREYELASVGAWDKFNDNIGDFDAVKETEVVLNEEAIRQNSRYNSNLLRFIELEGVPLKESNWLNKNIDQFIRKLQLGNTQLVIFDESNEVTGIWGEVMYYFMQHFNTSHSISLSPLRVNLAELSARNFQLQTSLFDSTPLEVKLTLMVRDNCFKPYLGLMAITVPSKEESQILNSASKTLKDVLNKVQDENEVTMTLPQFVESELTLLERDIPGNWSKRREYVESVLNFVSYFSLSPSSIWKVFMDKLESVEFSKNLPVIRDYIFRCLLSSGVKEDRRIGESLIMAFRPLGYELNEGEIEQSTSLIPNILNRSTNKEELLLKYLTEEFIFLKKDLKAVIITDFIDNSSASEIFPGNDFNSSSCGMMSILDKLENSAITLQLNPVVIYGNTIYFNPKFKTIMCKEVEKHAAKFDSVQAKQKQESGYCYISAIGTKDFQSFWKPLLNHLLEKKITHCVITGREFLSAKWDGINFNTYFNLSSATSELFGIRLLARILMIDNESIPAKHLWDFCAIMPEIELGMSDYLRVAHRKENGWHLCEDGEFEKSISYYHPMLKTELKTLSLDLINEINDTASRLIPTRQRTRDMWMAKSDLKNFEREVIEISMSNEIDPLKKFSVSRLKGKKTVTHNINCRDLVEAISRCMIDTIIELDGLEQEVGMNMTTRRPGVFRVEITDCEDAFKEKVLHGLATIFAPVSQQHYVVTVTCVEGKSGKILSRFFSDNSENFKVPFGVPEVLVNKKELATFMKNWQRTVSNDQMMGHRIPEVKKEVRAMIRRQKFNLRAECRTCKLLV